MNGNEDLALLVVRIASALVMLTGIFARIGAKCIPVVMTGRSSWCTCRMGSISANADMNMRGRSS
jgi:hypothetical protein